MWLLQGWWRYSVYEPSLVYLVGIRLTNVNFDIEHSVLQNFNTGALSWTTSGSSYSGKIDTTKFHLNRYDYELSDRVVCNTTVAHLDTSP